MTRTAVATALALALAAGPAFAKAHDQGVADGTYAPGEQTGAKTVIDSLEDAGVLDGKGVSAVVEGGARGAVASERKGGNRVTPTVND